MKKILKIFLLFMVLTTPILVSCGEAKPVSIVATELKTQFLSGEEFSVGNMNIVVNMDDGSKLDINIDDFALSSDKIYKNNDVVIDYSEYDKNQDGTYTIKITYRKDETKKYTYNVSVTTLLFTSDDIQVDNYSKNYDGKPHTIKVTQNLDATIKYGTSEGVYDLDTAPQYTDAGDYTVYFKVTKEGYSNEYEGIGTITISKIDLTVIPKDKTIEYNSEIGEIELEYSGFINDENEESALTGNLGYETEYQIGSDAGTYRVYLTGLTSKNYNVKYNSFILTVTKTLDKFIYLEIPNTYYGDSFEPKIETLSNGEITFRYQNSGYAQWHTANTIDDLPKNVGSYNIQVFVASTENYNGINSQIFYNVEVMKRNLTITAKDVTINYNEEFQSSGASSAIFEGFAPNELDGTISNIKTGVRYSVNYKKGDDAGEYEITISGVENNNYNIIYKNGKLTVNKLENLLSVQVLQKIIYGDDSDIVEVLENPSGNETKIEYSFNGGEYTTIEPKNVGNYTIKVYQNESTNYKSVEKTYNLIISQRVVEIEWNETEFTYDGNLHKPQATILNIVSGDTCDFDITGEKYQADEKGYIATMENLSNNNYVLPEENTVQFIIYKLAIDTPGSDILGQKIYTGNLLKSDIQDSDLYEVYENKGGIDFGSYPLKLKLKDSINYKWTDNPSSNILETSFKITKATDNYITAKMEDETYKVKTLKEKNNVITTYVYKNEIKETIQTNYYGEEIKPINCLAKYGNIEYRYSKNDKSYDDGLPTEVGKYYIMARVSDTDSYNLCVLYYGLEIKKSTYSAINKEIADLPIYYAYIGDTLGDIALPLVDCGVYEWQTPEKEFIEDLEKGYSDVGRFLTYVNFIPNDTKNYNKEEIAVLIYIENHQSGEIKQITDDYSIEYKTYANEVESGDDYSANVETVEFSETYQLTPNTKTVYIEAIIKDILTGETINDITVEFLTDTHNGTYVENLYIEIGEMESLEKEFKVYVKISKSGYYTYTDNLIFKLQDYVESVEYEQDNIAYLVGNQGDVNDVNLKATFSCGEVRQMKVGDFTIENEIDTSKEMMSVGQNITLKYNGVKCEGILMVCVYETFVSNLDIVIGDSERIKRTTRINDRTFEVYFTKLSDFDIRGLQIVTTSQQYFALMSISNVPVITSFSGDVEYELSLRLNDRFIDKYKLIVHYEIENIVEIKLGNQVAKYIEETNTYFIDTTNEVTYKNLTISRKIYKIYTQDKQELSRLNGDCYIEDYNTLTIIVEPVFKIARIRYSFTLQVTQTQIVINVIEIDGQKYELKDNHQVINITGNQCMLEIDRGVYNLLTSTYYGFDWCYTNYIQLEKTEDQNEYIFKICTSKNEQTCVQTFTIILN